MNIHALTAAFSLASAACALAPPVAASAITIPLGDYLNVLQSVEVEVSGKKRPFLFDTAGGATLFTPAVARAVGCEPFGRTTGFRHDGSRVDFQRCDIVELSIGGETMEVEGAVFDLMAMLPDGAPELGGIVSIHTLGKRPFTLDLASGTLTLESSDSLAKRIVDMHEIEVRPSTQGGGASYDLFLKVEASRGDLWLEIDSGNAAGLMLSPHAVTQLGLTPPAEGDATIPVTLQISGFGPYSAPAIVKDTIYDGLVDARFLRKHRMTVDTANGRAWLAAVSPDQ
jgi:hypothetical protein